MASKLSTLFRAMGFALVAIFAVSAMPATAQQPNSVNPTAQSVKEDQLMQALKPGAPVAGRISIPDQQAANLIQPGRDWRAFNQETLPRIGALALLGMLILVGLFYLMRGKIRIDWNVWRQNSSFWRD